MCSSQDLNITSTHTHTHIHMCSRHMPVCSRAGADIHPQAHLYCQQMQTRKTTGHIISEGMPFLALSLITDFSEQHMYVCYTLYSQFQTNQSQHVTLPYRFLALSFTSCVFKFIKFWLLVIQKMFLALTIFYLAHTINGHICRGLSE